MHVEWLWAKLREKFHIISQFVCSLIQSFTCFPQTTRKHTHTCGCVRTHPHTHVHLIVTYDNAVDNPTLLNLIEYIWKLPVPHIKHTKTTVRRDLLLHFQVQHTPTHAFLMTLVQLISLKQVLFAIFIFIYIYQMYKTDEDSVAQTRNDMTRQSQGTVTATLYTD